MGSIDTKWLVLAVGSLVIGGCASATEPTGKTALAIEDEELQGDEQQGPEQQGPEQQGPGMQQPGYGAPGYGDGAPGYGGYVGAPGYGVGYGVPGAIGGCDAFGNCYGERTYAVGGPFGYGYGRSTYYSSQSGSQCGLYGCIYY